MPLSLPQMLITILVSTYSLSLIAQDEFSFDVSSFEKKPYDFGGYVEFTADRQWLNTDSAAYKLNSSLFSDRSIINYQSATIELTGQYIKKNWQVSINAHVFTETDNLNSESNTPLYEGILAYKPEPGFTFEVGKKALKWGKGYAWNPTAFVERLKNPDEPDNSREGYTMATMDIINSFAGDLKTLAFTPVYFPVNEEINTDYSRVKADNYAAKLYLLYKDTDIDLVYLSEGSRSYRFGVDFARNLTTNFEIHAEWAYLSEVTKTIVDNTGAISTEKNSANQWLLGLRYLTENDTTLITEYYNNEAGYSAQQISDFFEATNSAYAISNTTLLSQLLSLSQQSYLKRNPGKQYLYVRLTNKEPFDWLYFTPAITVIKNLDDNSHSATAELIYTGFNNLELRLTTSWFQGHRYTEFDEKRNNQKVEFRLRYYY